MLGNILSQGSSAGGGLPTSVDKKPGVKQLSQKQGFSYQADSFQMSVRDSAGTTYDISLLKERAQSFDFQKYTEQDQGTFGDIRGKSQDSFTQLLQTSYSSYSLEISVQKDSGSTGELSTEELINQLPDKWKPQGVVDSIMSFVQGFEGKTDAEGREFFEMTKNAVLKGAEEALKKLEGFPDSVVGVAEETVRALKEALENWGQERGWISSEQEPTEPTPDASSGLDITA
ncbi:hypothetical protein [Chitinivibrio alkaliphilus]|uniref:DUF5610 domain-containing protein n=1 Tax=Chitinivibrio alkaliphilus ACht1 TaxID=1313304 RepID=U7D8V3_9BACT|nr:hypothetical protein [Chitinivibrio alkaliphilus]ERP38814.1 hypothetical protein CALK_0585 [Chitinivibrio alkaliphilus ACht1]